MKFALIFAFFAVASAGVYRARLTKTNRFPIRRKGFTSHHANGELIDGIQNKQTGRHPLANLLSGALTTMVKIGREQKFTMFVDTGSDLTWVTDVGCSTPLCRSKKRYDRKLSSTYISDGKKFKQEYNSGESASGVYGVDLFIFDGGNSPPLEVESQHFGQANEMEWLDYDGSDGLLGLSLDAYADYPHPLLNAYERGLLDSPLFTIYVNHTWMEKNPLGGELTYGAVDNVNCGSVIRYVDVNHQIYWQVALQYVSVGGQKIYAKSGKNWNAVIDSGVADILGPKKEVDIIKKAILKNVNASKNDGYYMVACETQLPSVTFVIAGDSYKVESRSLLRPTSVAGWCAISISKHPLDRWDLGMAFMNQFCIVHDMLNSKIGMAPIKNR